MKITELIKIECTKEELKFALREAVEEELNFDIFDEDGFLKTFMINLKYLGKR